MRRGEVQSLFTPSSSSSSSSSCSSDREVVCGAGGVDGSGGGRGYLCLAKLVTAQRGEEKVNRQTVLSPSSSSSLPPWNWVSGLFISANDLGGGKRGAEEGGAEAQQAKGEGVCGKEVEGVQGSVLGESPPPPTHTLITAGRGTGGGDDTAPVFWVQNGGRECCSAAKDPRGSAC